VYLTQQDQVKAFVMGYWTDKVGSQPAAKRAAPAKSRGSSSRRGQTVATTKSSGVNRCGVCGKTARGCTCHQVGEAIPTRRGTPKAKADRVDDNGIVWCGTCNMRTHHGTCMNVTCSTRGGR